MGQATFVFAHNHTHTFQALVEPKVSTTCDVHQANHASVYKTKAMNPTDNARLALIHSQPNIYIHPHVSTLLQACMLFYLANACGTL